MKLVNLLMSFALIFSAHIASASSGGACPTDKMITADTNPISIASAVLKTGKKGAAID